jgi:predicted aspartyl protease
MTPSRSGIARRAKPPEFLLVALALALLSTPAAASAGCAAGAATRLALAAERWPVVEMGVDGRPAWFLVDTGAELSSVTPEAALALRLPRDRRRRTRLTTLSGTATRANAVVRDLALGDIDLGGRSLAVAPLRRLGASRRLDGILGADVLAAFDVEVDMPRRALTLFRDRGCAVAGPPWTAPYETLRTSITSHGLTRLPVAIDGRPLTALFDTGADRIVVARRTAIGLGVTPTTLADAPKLIGTSGGRRSVTAARHAFAALTIGAETFRDLPVLVGRLATGDADLILGAEYLRGRRVFLAYATRRLFVQREAGGGD